MSKFNYLTPKRFAFTILGPYNQKTRKQQASCAPASARPQKT